MPPSGNINVVMTLAIGKLLPKAGYIPLAKMLVVVYVKFGVDGIKMKDLEKMFKKETDLVFEKKSGVFAVLL